MWCSSCSRKGSIEPLAFCAVVHFYVHGFKGHILRWFQTWTWRVVAVIFSWCTLTWSMQCDRLEEKTPKSINLMIFFWILCVIGNLYFYNSFGCFNSFNWRCCTRPMVWGVVACRSIPRYIRRRHRWRGGPLCLILLRWGRRGSSDGLALVCSYGTLHLPHFLLLVLELRC